MVNIDMWLALSIKALFPKPYAQHFGIPFTGAQFEVSELCMDNQGRVQRHNTRVKSFVIQTGIS